MGAFVPARATGECANTAHTAVQVQLWGAQIFQLVPSLAMENQEKNCSCEILFEFTA